MTELSLLFLLRIIFVLGKKRACSGLETTIAGGKEAALLSAVTRHLATGLSVSDGKVPAFRADSNLVRDANR